MLVTKKNFGASSILLSDILNWCTNNQDIPEDDDDVFASNFDVSSNENGEPTMRLFFTTKRLIRITASNKVHICADATYKLNWQGNPVLIVGTTDQNSTNLIFLFV